MSMLEISLPGSMKSFVNSQASAQGFDTPAEYVQSLIRKARKELQRAKLEAELLEAVEALDRGEGKEMTDADWKRLRAGLRTRRTKVKQRT